MPYSSLQQLLEALLAFVTTHDGDRRFAMPPAGLGWPPVEQAIAGQLPLTGGDWVVDPAGEPAIDGERIVFSGRMDILLGQTPALVDVAFDLADGGGDEPSLLVAFAPLDPRQPDPIPGWNLGDAIPLWDLLRSPIAELELDDPRFYVSSIARPASADRPALPAGLSFNAGEVKRSGILAPLGYLPGLRLTQLAGGITGGPAAPHAQLSAAPVAAIPIQYLDLPITFSAISTDPVESGQIQTPPPPVATYLQLASQVHIGGPEVPPIPIELDFAGLGDVFTFQAQLEAISRYGIGEFSELVHDAPIGTYLQEYLPLDTVALKRLDVMVSTAPLGIAGIGLGLGTTRSLTVVPGYVEIPDVHVDFLVDDPVSDPSITAVLSGEFLFLETIPVRLGAVFPEMRFYGGLVTEPPLALATIVNAFVPSVRTVPDVWLDRLWVDADLKQRRYAFQLAVTSDWKIPIGIARFELQQASLALGYDANLASGFSGEVAATAVLFSERDVEIARFFADWRLPGELLIEGTFPEIPLTDLARTLTGGAVPNAGGVPEITLRNSTVRFRMAEGASRELRLTGTTTYRFTLATTIVAEKIGEADLFFEVRRGTDSATGFVAGLVLRPEWKPDALWGDLAGVFDLLTVNDAGLVLSSIEDDSFSLPNLTAAYVPAQVKPGVTFFSALELTGDVFSPLRQLFDSDVELDLYAHIDPSRIADSEIVARLPGSDGKGAVSFTGLDIGMRPGRGEFSIAAGARFDIYGERLTLEGSGRIMLEPPAATFAIRVANWNRPFGIDGLDILTFGLSFTVSGVGVSIGLLGDFLIGSDPAEQFRFAVGGQILNFEAPSSLLFKLESAGPRPLRVTDLVEQYTGLDVSDVPLLGGLAFLKLDFYVVSDPAGWQAPDGHFYPQGIGIDADITLYDEWEIKLFLEVGSARGILSDGSISAPIAILDLLVISDAAGEKGPRVHIDTSGLPPYEVPVAARLAEQRMRRLRPPPGATPVAVGINPYTVVTAGDPEKTYFAFSGAVRLLGLHESFSGSATDGGFEVDFHAELADLFRASFMSSFSKSSGFQGHAEGNFDFKLDFPDGVKIDGWQVLPPVVVSGPQAFLSIDAVVSLSEAHVALVLDFRWGTYRINPSFTLDARQVASLLADLWQRIVDWIHAHLKEFFRDLLESGERYASSIADGFIWAGQSALEVALALYHVFDVKNMERMAQLLIQAERLDYDEMVAALMRVFDAGFDAAVAALRSAGEMCAVATNEAALYLPEDLR